MAEEKRFYWIKLKEEFFNLDTIDWIISQENGCEYIVLYQKLCLLTANKGGQLVMQMGEMIIPYDINKISRDTKFSIDTVKKALDLFQSVGLIYEESDGILKIPYVEEVVGSETSSAQRVRKHRAKKTLEDEKTEEKKLSLSSEEHRNKKTDTADDKLQNFYSGIMLTDNQVGDLLEKMGLEAFDFYIEKAKRYPNIKNYYKTILKWYDEDRANP